MLKNFASRLFPRHTWKCNEAEDFRECQVCGRTEELDFGGFASVWVAIEDGDRKTHVVKTDVANQHRHVDSECAVACEQTN